jgi:hypothetical protein
MVLEELQECLEYLTITETDHWVLKNYNTDLEILVFILIQNKQRLFFKHLIETETVLSALMSF